MKLSGQFHPSRDVHNKPTEYELPYGGDKGVYITGSGYYDDAEDLERSTQYEREGGETGSSLLQPAQGRLFDADKHEAAQRQKLGRLRFDPMTDSAAEQIRNRALQSSTIPTSHLQDRPGRMWTDITTRNDTSNGSWEGSGVSGWYRGPATSAKPDVIAINPSSGHGTDTTFIHEAGHRRHLGEGESYSDYTTHPRVLQADPLKEGVADAYVDRYGGPNNPQVRPMQEDIEAGGGQKFTSYNFTGYSADKEAAGRRGWNADDRALYAAVRGHASETGEQALYTPRGGDVREQPGMAEYGGGNATIDATLHSLLSTSPHAAQALRQTGLKEQGGRAFRRHRDRELLSQGQAVQGSLFSELRGVASGELRGFTPNIDAMPTATNPAEFEAKFEGMQRDIDSLEQQHGGELIMPQHMSHNQFGEKPRTVTDVSRSLGVRRAHAEQAGFTPH